MRLFFIILSVALAPWVSAQELQEGVVYNGGDKISVGEEGITMTIPAGWQGGVSGDLFLMTKPGTQGVLVVMSERANAQEIEMFMSVPQDLGDGYSIHPTSQPTRSGDSISVSLTLREGFQQYPAEFYAKTSQFGRAVGVISVIVQPSARSETIAAGKQALASVQLTKPDIPNPGEATGPWASTIAGKRLKHASSTSTTSSSGAYAFCRNGEFTYYGSESGYSNTDFYDGSSVSVSHAGSGGDNGQWALKGAKIYLWYADGSEGQLEVTTNSEGNIFLNGTRYYRTGEGC